MTVRCDIWTDLDYRVGQLKLWSEQYVVPSRFAFMHHPLQNTYVLSPLSSPRPSPFYSFDALDAYIQSQKALLARTQSDLDRLRRIRDQAATHPETFFDSFDEKVFFFFNFQTSLSDQ